MNAEIYAKAKSLLKTRMSTILKDVPSIDEEKVNEWVIHYIMYDEPQIAYTNLVAMIVKANQPIKQKIYNEIFELGNELNIKDGVTWDEEEADKWWYKLKSLVAW